MKTIYKVTIEQELTEKSVNYYESFESVEAVVNDFLKNVESQFYSKKYILRTQKNFDTEVYKVSADKSHKLVFAKVTVQDIQLNR